VSGASLRRERGTSAAALFDAGVYSAPFEEEILWKEDEERLEIFSV
jgi:hypothetical protein